MAPPSTMAVNNYYGCSLLITPPMSPTDLTLPPIHHQQRPLTPPDDDDIFLPKPEYPVDWLDFTRTRSAHFIAEKTCEMICYLWFSSPTRSRSRHRPAYPSPNNSPSSSPPTTTLQLVATSTFVQFLQKLLETTQVSQSVIVLSLHYIYRLKERNRFTPAQSGSEFRIAVAALMMANKFLDDNTYTNKTWSEVSGIDLDEINRMEREFLLGVDFNLYVDKPTYESWLNLLKGLVLAKERDCHRFRKSRIRVPATGPLMSSAGSTRYKIGMATARARSTSPSSKPVSYHSTYAQRQREQEQAYPTPATSTSSNCPSPTPRPGSKRNAAAAFSPTSASFSHLPAKRPLSEYAYSSSTFTPSTSNNDAFTPSSSISTTPSRAPQRPGLQIPEYRPHGSAPNSYSPLEGLQSFVEKMSIGASPGFGVASQVTHSQTHPSSHGSSHPSTSTTQAHSSSYPSQTPAQPQIPTTLVAAYAHDERRRSVVPQNLYFYTLACSPVEERDVCLPVEGEGSESQEGRAMEGQRNSKTRLRYHQPAASGRQHGVGYGDEFPSAASAFTTAASRRVSYGNGNALHGMERAGYRYPQAVQSASTSPNDLDVRRVGRRLGQVGNSQGQATLQQQQQQQYSPQKSFPQQYYSPQYHASSSQQASPQHQPPPLAQHHHHHQHQRAQGTSSHHSSPLYRPLNSSQSQQQQGYHQASPHLSQGASPQYHQHQPQRHSRQMQSQGLPRFHDNVWNTQPAVVAAPPPHTLPEEEVEVLTARQEVFPPVFAAPAPKYALPVVLRSGEEVEMGQGDDYEEDDEMGEEEEEEEECGEDDEGMEDENDEERYDWSQVEQQQQRRQEYHDATTATYHSNETNYRPNGDESTYRPNETTTTAYNHANKTMYRPETATAATFANAGPPGVCFYPTPSLSAYQYSYPSRQYSSSRRW